MSEDRPLRDVLGVLLVVVTALLYAVERDRTQAMETPSELEAAEVVELPPPPAAQEIARAVPTVEADGRS